MSDIIAIFRKRIVHESAYGTIAVNEISRRVYNHWIIGTLERAYIFLLKIPRETRKQINLPWYDRNIN